MFDYRSPLTFAFLRAEQYRFQSLQARFSLSCFFYSLSSLLPPNPLSSLLFSSLFLFLFSFLSLSHLSLGCLVCLYVIWCDCCRRWTAPFEEMMVASTCYTPFSSSLDWLQLLNVCYYPLLYLPVRTVSSLHFKLLPHSLPCFVLWQSFLDTKRGIFGGLVYHLIKWRLQCLNHLSVGTHVYRYVNHWRKLEAGCYSGFPENVFNYFRKCS